MAQNPPALTNRPAVRGDEVDRLQRRIDDLRGEIGADVYRIESRVREAFDLRRQVARHPLVAAAVVLGGVIVAARMVQALLLDVRALGAAAPPGARSREPRAVARVRTAALPRARAA